MTKKKGRFEKDVRSLWNHENGPRTPASMSPRVGIELIFFFSGCVGFFGAFKFEASVKKLEMP